MSTGATDWNLGYKVADLARTWEREKENAAVGICTRHRAGNVKSLALCGPIRTVLFVEPHEIEEYRAKHTQEIVSLPKDHQGLPFARAFQLSFFQEVGIRWMFVLDDDFLSLQARTWELVKGQYWRLRALEPKDHWMVYAGLIHATLHRKAGRTGLSYQQANWRTREPLLEIAKANNWCVLDTEILARHGITWDLGIIIFEDWDISLALLRKRVPVNCWYGASFGGTKMASNKGGLQSFDLDRADVSKRDIQLLRKKYGSVVSARWSEAHGMFEPRVDWARLKRYMGAA